MEKELQRSKEQNEKSNEIEKENDVLKLQLSKTEQKLQDYQRQNQSYSKDIQSKQYVTTCFVSHRYQDVWDLYVKNLVFLCSPHNCEKFLNNSSDQKQQEIKTRFFDR